MTIKPPLFPNRHPPKKNATLKSSKSLGAQLLRGLLYGRHALGPLLRFHQGVGPEATRISDDLMEFYGDSVGFYGDFVVIHAVL